MFAQGVPGLVNRMGIAVYTTQQTYAAWTTGVIFLGGAYGIVYLRRWFNIVPYAWYLSFAMKTSMGYGQSWDMTFPGDDSIDMNICNNPDQGTYYIYTPIYRDN